MMRLILEIIETKYLKFIHQQRAVISGLVVYWYNYTWSWVFVSDTSTSCLPLLIVEQNIIITTAEILYIYTRSIISLQHGEPRQELCMWPREWRLRRRAEISCPTPWQQTSNQKQSGTRPRPPSACPWWSWSPWESDSVLFVVPTPGWMYLTRDDEEMGWSESSYWHYWQNQDTFTSTVGWTLEMRFRSCNKIWDMSVSQEWNEMSFLKGWTEWVFFLIILKSSSTSRILVISDWALCSFLSSWFIFFWTWIISTNQRTVLQLINQSELSITLLLLYLDCLPSDGFSGTRHSQQEWSPLKKDCLHPVRHLVSLHHPDQSEASIIVLTNQKWVLSSYWPIRI